MALSFTTAEVINCLAVTLGHYSVDTLKMVFSRYKFRLSTQANKMMETKEFIPFATKKEPIRLVARTVRDLGFNNGAEYQHICARAIMRKLELCPAEIGPQLRRLCTVQQENSGKVRIAMKSLTVSRANYIFVLYCDEKGLWLDAEEMRPDDFFESDALFVFILPFRPRALLSNK